MGGSDVRLEICRELSPCGRSATKKLLSGNTPSSMREAVMKDQIELLRSFLAKLPVPVPHLIAALGSDYYSWKFSHPSWTKGHIHFETTNHDIIGSVTFCAKRIICSSAIIEAAEVG